MASGRLDAARGPAWQADLARSLLGCLGIAAAYAAAGAFGLLLATEPGYAMAIWPAAGIALAAVLLLGYRAALGVLLGSFGVNVWAIHQAGEVFTLLESCGLAGAIGLGASLQAVTGAALIRRYVGFPTPLHAERDIVAFFALGGPASCVVSATFGAAALGIAGAVASGDLVFTWATWWVGDTIGALIVTPIVLVLAAKPGDPWRRRRLSVALPLCGLYLLSVVFFVTARGLEHDRIVLEFDRRATVLAGNLQRLVEADLEVLYAVEGLFSSGAEVHRASFHRFVKSFLERQQGLHAVSWNPWVRDEQRQSVEEAARREGHLGFEFRDLGADGAHVPSVPAEGYVPVLYIEPLAGNAEALGLNVNSHPARARALSEARDTGRPVATTRVTLVQETGDRAGVLVFHPIYDSAQPPTSVDARRRALRGFAVGVFLVGEMVEAAVRHFDLEGIHLGLYDELGSGQRVVLYQRSSTGSGGPGEAGAASEALVANAREIHWDRTLRVAGREWTFTCHLTPAYLMAHRGWQAGAVLTAGLLVATLLGALLLMLTGRSARHARLALELAAVNRDLQREMSERSRAEEELRQSQKLEAVGRLAGGIAHDFNNLLQVILSCSEETLRRLPPGSPEREDVEEVLRAGDQGAQITRQLLALGRRQVLEARVLDLNDFVERTATMLERIVGEEIELVLKLDPLLGYVKLDPGQIEQVLLNLIVNARDAMPDGGRLEIATTAGVERGSDPADDGSEEWITLAVSDTGHGLSPEARDHLFEPFFTTKGVGEGSGLGLSVVHGIVEQSGGRIQVDSAPGRGTTVRIAFPRVEAQPVTPAPPVVAHSSTGDESILLVEDEPGVRRLVARTLRAQGYDVTDVASPTQALSVFGERGGAFDLVLSDVIMPGMNGRELARRLHRKRSDLKILFMSGYPEDIITRDGVLEPGTPCLRKPFDTEVLCEAIRSALDAAREA